MADKVQDCCISFRERYLINEHLNAFSQTVWYHDDLFMSSALFLLKGHYVVL